MHLDWLTQHVFKPYPELLIMVSVALGFLAGRIHYRAIGLGAVTGCLVAGLVMGYVTGVEIDATVKSVFFDLFLFALGYKVGPQFFRALRKDGLPQVAIALVVTVAGLLVCWGISLMQGYSVGTAAGFLGGTLTQSAVIGVAQDAISNIQGLSHAQIAHQANLVPIVYAVTYPLGTILCAILLADIAPKYFFRTDMARDTALLAKELDSPEENPDLGQGYYEVVLRAHTVAAASIEGRSIDDFENQQRQLGRRVYLTRVRRDGQIIDHDQDTVLARDDVVAVSALRHDLVALDPETAIGPEADDVGLLGYRTEHLHVVAAQKDQLGKTVAQLRREPFMVGVFIDKIYRAGSELHYRLTTPVERGDTLVLTGPKRLVDPAAHAIGKPVPTSVATDMIWVGLGVFLGGCIGIPALHAGGVPISLSTSGGALIMGLIFGWIRGRRPTFGNVPPGAQWFMDTLGLCLFVTVVGINAGPSFSSGLSQVGWSVLGWGAVATVLPLIVGLLFGRYVFKVRVPLLMANVAGAQTTTAAIGAITESAESQIPTLGYTVPYAVGNVLLTVWGSIIVALIGAKT